MPLAGPKMPKNAFFEASDAFQSLRCFSKPQMSFQSFQSHKCSDESLTTGSSRHTWPLLTAVTLSLLLILPCIYTSFFSLLGRTGFEICKPWFLFCQNARPLLPLLQGFVCQKKKKKKLTNPLSRKFKASFHYKLSCKFQASMWKATMGRDSLRAQSHFVNLSWFDSILKSRSKNGWK